MGVGQTVKVGQENTGGHDQSVTVAHDQSVSVGNDQKLEVTNNRNKSGGNDQDSKVSGKDTEAGEKSQTNTVGENFSLTVTSSSTIDSGDVIELKCGASLLRMDSSEKVTITGRAFDFEADRPVKITGNFHL